MQQATPRLASLINRSVRPICIPSYADRPREHLRGRPVGKMHAKVVLGSQGHLEHGRNSWRDVTNNRGLKKLGKRVGIVILIVWMLDLLAGSSWSSNIYGGWSYPSRKHISNVFCKFPTSKHEPEPSWTLTGLGSAKKTSLAGSKTDLTGFIRPEQADRAT
jgi:hypothetical protein